MKSIVLAACILVSAGWACGAESRELRVHLVQANNDSPYTFVRAKFEPGEISDPWAVRFFDEKGAEIPCFVWDSVTWQVAREGREDWGRRYALLNHAPGNAPEVVGARARKLEWAKQNLPKLGAELAAQDEAAKRSGNSVCAALYLLRHRAPAFGKQRLTLRIYPAPQSPPKRQEWRGPGAAQGIAAAQGDLRLENLPDRIAVTWQGKEIFRYAGFDAGGSSGASGHADPARPFAISAEEGIITRLHVRSQTPGRQGAAMDWQCTYWLFPEGCYTALEGFSPGDTAGYIGGRQVLSTWQAPGDFAEVREPAWETPWWLHRAGENGFVATHLFHSTPLTIGYGNNPFTVNPYAPPGKVPKMELQAGRLGLYWYCSLEDLSIARLFAPELYFRLGHAYAQQPETGRTWLDGNREVLLAGRVVNPPDWMTPEARRFVDGQLAYIRWQPRIDWLYRQYAVGVGPTESKAESALRGLMGAAAGWIDRPADEEEIASLLVETARRLSAGARLKWSKQMQVLPHLLNPDPAGVKMALARWPSEAAEADRFINLIKTHVSLGGNPIEGKTGGQPGGPYGEGWIVNPSYRATELAYELRFLEHFDLPHPQEEDRQAAVRFADFTLELLGGKPLDTEKLRRSYLSHWPSRFVAVIPLMLAANSVKADKDYVRGATIMFDILMNMVERNPQGYWSAWSADPKKAEMFDTVYNSAGLQRGIPAFWADGCLDMVGRDRASHFTAAQARYLVFSGLFLDTFETDNVTAAYATKHGGHPAERKQIVLYLFDDFAFYRGLVADTVRWAAASPSRPGGQGDLAAGSADRELGLAESGCYLLRWALGIGPWLNQKSKVAGTRWFEHRVTRPADGGGFRLQIWNRLPWAESTLTLTPQEVGVKPGQPGGKGPSATEAIWLRLGGPAYRVPFQVEVSPKGDRLSVKFSRGLTIRLSHRVLCPDWPQGARPALFVRRPDGSTVAVGGGAILDGDFVQWQAEAGEYEIIPVSADKK